MSESPNPALLAQADLLFLITKLLTPPSLDTKTLLQHEVPDIDELIAKINSSHLAILTTIYQQLRKAAEITTLEEWLAEYNRLFETSALCGINESSFIRRDKGAILADIAGFYGAFGMQLADNATEKVDHLIGELEFIALLLVMLAKAQDQQATSTTYDALAAFSFDHLGEWLPAFCDKLTALTVLPIYQQLAALLSTTWAGIIATHHLPVPDPSISSGYGSVMPEDLGTPYECDMADTNL